MTPTDTTQLPAEATPAPAPTREQILAVFKELPTLGHWRDLLSAERDLVAAAAEGQQTLQAALAKSEADAASLREALEANHRWHQDSEEAEGYAESELCDTNMEALSTTSGAALLAEVAELRKSEKLCRACDEELSGNAGIGRIAAERRRQKSVEGWTPEHDAQHSRGEMAKAAEHYAWAAGWVIRGGRSIDALLAAPNDWPWERQWWKPSADPIRNLEKAGALIAAEIDRLLRAAIDSAANAGGAN